MTMEKSRSKSALSGLLLMIALVSTATVTFSAVDTHAQKRLNVVTTLTDLADITKYIGGDRVEVLSIATGYQNPHFVDPKPSHILKLLRADLFVTSGLDLTSGWVPPLLSSSRNSDIQPGGSGFVDTSVGVELLNVPTNTSRDQGDIHIFGNPHYWLDPARGHQIAHNIHAALVAVEPESEAYFTANLVQFDTTLEGKIKEWHTRMEPYEGAKIVAFHDQWPYFETAFGLDIVDFLEPKPGIPPTPSQLTKVMETMKSNEVHVIIISPYYKPDTAALVARQVGAHVVTLAPSVGAFEDVESYFDVFEHNLKVLIEALQPGTD